MTAPTIRPARPDDTAAVYSICLRTSADGDDATGRYARTRPARPHLGRPVPRPRAAARAGARGRGGCCRVHARRGRQPGLRAAVRRALVAVAAAADQGPAGRTGELVAGPAPRPPRAPPADRPRPGGRALPVAPAHRPAAARAGPGARPAAHRVACWTCCAPRVPAGCTWASRRPTCAPRASTEHSGSSSCRRRANDGLHGPRHLPRRPGVAGRDSQVARPRMGTTAAMSRAAASSGAATCTGYTWRSTSSASSWSPGIGRAIR